MPSDQGQGTVLLTEEDLFLIEQREHLGLQWKEITQNYQKRFGKVYRDSALQMKFKRMKDRTRMWTNDDVSNVRQPDKNMCVLNET